MGPCILSMFENFVIRPIWDSEGLSVISSSALGTVTAYLCNLLFGGILLYQLLFSYQQSQYTPGTKLRPVITHRDKGKRFVDLLWP